MLWVLHACVTPLVWHNYDARPVGDFDLKWMLHSDASDNEFMQVMAIRTPYYGDCDHERVWTPISIWGLIALRSPCRHVIIVLLTGTLQGRAWRVLQQD